jgi:tetratricopeptide (TPR) repeat protein
MGLISLKCLNCGGGIQLDDAREFGFCMYCGHKMILTNNIPQKVSVDETHKMRNWETMGTAAYRARNPKELREISNKMLEYDADNYAGWFFKGAAAIFEGNPEEAFECWKMAVDVCDDKETIDEFYKASIELSGQYFEKNPKQAQVLNKSDGIAELTKAFLEKEDKNSERNFATDLAKRLKGEIKGENSKIENNFILTNKNDIRVVAVRCDELVSLGRDTRSKGGPDEELERDIDFYLAVSSVIKNAISTLSKKKLDDLSEYWDNLKEKPVVFNHLITASKINTDDTTKFPPAKLREKRNEEIKTYVRNMLSKKNE